MPGGGAAQRESRATSSSRQFRQRRRRLPGQKARQQVVPPHSPPLLRPSQGRSRRQGGRDTQPLRRRRAAAVPVRGRGAVRGSIAGRACGALRRSRAPRCRPSCLSPARCSSPSARRWRVRPAGAQRRPTTTSAPTSSRAPSAAFSSPLTHRTARRSRRAAGVIVSVSLAFLRKTNSLHLRKQGAQPENGQRATPASAPRPPLRRRSGAARTQQVPVWARLGGFAAAHHRAWRPGAWALVKWSGPQRCRLCAGAQRRRCTPRSRVPATFCAHSAPRALAPRTRRLLCARG